MGHKTKELLPTPDALRTLYAPIRGELDEVEAILCAELQSHFPFVDSLVKHGFRLGGKRLRPALVLLSGKACGELNRAHLVVAAVMELVHTATLIHDDVLDEAALRRHLQTVNARWDNETSVLLGDYLFARAICLAATLDDTTATRTIADASRAMCEGELRQVGSRGNFALSEEEYLDIIAQKTAALCACCCRLGAHFSGADVPSQDALGRFGRQVGVAFQIVDDLLDVQGNEADTGKSLGTDLVKQKPTLPLIRLLGRVTGPQRTDLVQTLTHLDGHHADVLAPWFKGSDAIAYSQERAMHYVNLAKSELDRVAPSASRDALKELAEFVVARDQ
jgi:octaprenyl-diphosphate synthase